jgi:hypothetical protein
MYICNQHDETIVYESRECPMCKLEEEKDAEIEKLEDELEDWIKDYNTLRDQHNQLVSKAAKHSPELLI